MASTISAGTTSTTAISLSGDTSGNLAFQTQAGTYTQTVPNATGTVMVSGNMPAFSAYFSGSNNAITAGVWTKVALNAEDFDTANCFDSTTNYRFTPNVAGYYQINCVCSFQLGGSASVGEFLCIYKNGSIYKGTYGYAYNAYQTAQTMNAVVYLNGSTDYIEMYVYINTSTGGYDGASKNNLSTGAGATQTMMSGALIRSA